MRASSSEPKFHYFMQFLGKKVNWQVGAHLRGWHPLWDNLGFTTADNQVLNLCPGVYKARGSPRFQVLSPGMESRDSPLRTTPGNHSPLPTYFFKLLMGAKEVD